MIVNCARFDLLWFVFRETALHNERPIVFCSLNDELSDLDSTVFNRRVAYSERWEVSA